MTKRIKQCIICLSIAVSMLFLGYFGGVIFTSADSGAGEENSQNAIAALQEANNESNNALVLTAQYLESLVPSAANLSQKKVAIFVTNDTQTKTLTDIEDLLKKSNAVISSVTLINPIAIDDNQASQTASIVNHTLPAGATINPAYENVGERFGVELAWLTLAPAHNGTITPAVHTVPVGSNIPVSSSNTDHPSDQYMLRARWEAEKKAQAKAASLRDRTSQANALSFSTGTISATEIDKSTASLVENHLITLLDTKLQGDADYALVLTGNKFTPGESMILAGIASGLAERGSGVVLASPNPSVNSPVQVARSLEAYRKRISTVDDSDSILGEVTSVLALHHGRATEQYGYTSTSTKAFPVG